MDKAFYTTRHIANYERRYDEEDYTPHFDDDEEE